MTKLLGIRTVYDTDPTKTFRIADILETGAILPHSVSIAELMVMDLEPADDDKPETCTCYEHIGDNPNCPIHGENLTHDEEIKSAYYSDYGADYKERNDLYCAGMGC